MPVSYNRISLTDSIGYSEILDPKLKTNTLRIQFFHPLEKESAAKSALAFSLLTTSNAVYPSMEELAKKLQGGLPAIALTNHTALSSAFANDVDGMLSYAQQLNGYGKAGDVFLGISTSGNSENVMYAAVTAKAKGLKVVGLTGKTGGKLAKLADVAIIVPEQETYKIQELHLPIYHALCLMLEDRFYAE